MSENDDENVVMVKRIVDIVLSEMPALIKSQMLPTVRATVRPILYDMVMQDDSVFDISGPLNESSCDEGRKPRVTNQSLSDLKNKIVGFEDQFAEISAKQKALSDLLTDYEKIIAPAEKEVGKKSTISGSIFLSLQKQITTLKSELSKIQSCNSSIQTAIQTSQRNYDEVSKMQRDVCEVKRQLIKVSDIEDFQNFVSSQYHDMYQTVVEHSKFVTDIENNLRSEMQGGLAHFENKFFSEHGKSLTQIRNDFTKVVADNSKTVQNLHDKFLKNDKIKYYEDKIDQVKRTLENYEQYLRRNCLVVCGVEEKKGENTNKIAADLFRDMGFKVNTSHFDRSHRLKSKFDSRSHKRNLPRPIIVKFVNHDVKEEIFEQRDLLRYMPNCKGIYLNESLTVYRTKLYREVRNLHNLGWSTWTRDGIIFVCEGPRYSGAKQHRITTYQDYYKIIEDIGASQPEITFAHRT